MAKEYILALDQGTTGSRAILLNSKSEFIASHYEEISQIYPNPGWIEHDPVEIWNITLSCIKQTLAKSKVDPRDIAGIGITNQRETLTAWDKKTGKPFYNSIGWACRRSSAICEELREKGLEQEIRERTGVVLDPYFSASKIMWLRDNVDGLKEKMDKNEVCVGTIDTWLMWNLTGGASHVTDYSNGSRTMALNVRDLKWDDFLLGEMGLNKEILPELKPSSGIFGYTDKDVFFGARVPIAGVAGDQHAALFGQACFKPGMIKNTYGTALAILLNIGNDFVLSKNKQLTDLAWVVDDKVTYALEGTVFSGGAVVQWLRDGIKIIDQASDTESYATQVPDTGGVYFVPAFTGLAAPYWDPYARGTMMGINRFNKTRTHNSCGA